jgi:hypothetical protein
MFEWIIHNLGYKFTDKNLKQIEEFKELYGRTIAKENELKEKTEKPIEMSFYYFESPDRNHKELFEVLRWKSIKINIS